MIRFLQRQRAKKGFTIIELIVVIAVIAVLMAIILPLLSNERSRKQEANSAAKDFYAAVQTIMSSYSMYEAPLSPKYQENLDLGEMRYFEKAGGNYPYKHREGTDAPEMPVNASIYVLINTKNARITDIYTYVTDEADAGYSSGDGFYQLCKRSNSSSEFGKLLKAEIEDRISYQDGCYYAKASYDKNEPGVLKVKYTGYTRKPLPSPGSMSLVEYQTKVMNFTKDNKLANGEIFGVCASMDPTTGVRLGMMGTALN